VQTLFEGKVFYHVQERQQHPEQESEVFNTFRHRMQNLLMNVKNEDIQKTFM
jgi:hypothetical protein